MTLKSLWIGLRIKVQVNEIDEYETPLERGQAKSRTEIGQGCIHQTRSLNLGTHPSLNC